MRPKSSSDPSGLPPCVTPLYAPKSKSGVVSFGPKLVLIVGADVALIGVDVTIEGAIVLAVEGLWLVVVVTTAVEATLIVAIVVETTAVVTIAVVVMGAVVVVAVELDVLLTEDLVVAIRGGVILTTTRKQLNFIFIKQRFFISPSRNVSIQVRYNLLIIIKNNTLLNSFWFQFSLVSLDRLPLAGNRPSWGDDSPWGVGPL